MTSIFDLSPSEKLQLVQDLWDGLAATPEEVPLPDWQKRELDRRRENLKKHPASGLEWAEVKRRLRARNGLRLVLAPELEQDLVEAQAWYEGRMAGLGNTFLLSVDACLASICRNPEVCSVIYDPYRRALVRRFPYAAIHEFAGDTVTVYGVLHTSRDPGATRERLP